MAETFRAVLGHQSVDKFDPQLLREEPMDKVRALITEAKALHLL